MRLLFVLPLLALAVPLLAQSPSENPAANYRRGKALLERPVRMADEMDRRCGNLTAAEWKEREQSPHAKKYAQVYINRVGQTVLSKVAPRFPVGTILTKEKFSNPAGKGTPELLTVMVKREKGYNAACRDWEFLVVDGKGSRILERGKLERCQGCHAQEKYQRTDGVATLNSRGVSLTAHGSR